jgi:branched-chain amino acid transport system permease protein
VAFAALAAAAPFVLPEFALSILVVAGLNAIVAIGLSLLLGYAGQISLGHAGFSGLAAYATAVLTTSHGWPVPAAIAAALLLTGVVAALVGIPTLKLKGHYLGMATLGVGVIVSIVLNEATEVTGGPSGLPGIPRLSAAGVTVSSDRGYAFVAWGAAFLLFVLARNLVRSRAGRALRAIHTSEAAASVLGIDVPKYKRFVFVLSALYAALSGALYAHYVTFVSPGTFSFHASVQYVTMVVLGGMGSLWGALLGAVFLTALPEFLRAVENFDIVIYGAILLACTLFLREGLAGAGASVLRLFRRAPAAKEGEGK